MHTPLVQTPKKEGFKHTVRTKFSQKARNPTAVYLHKSLGCASKGSRDDIVKKSSVRAAVLLSSVWFQTKQFGVSRSRVQGQLSL